MIGPNKSILKGVNFSLYTKLLSSWDKNSAPMMKREGDKGSPYFILQN